MLSAILWGRLLPWPSICSEAAELRLRPPFLCPQTEGLSNLETKVHFLNVDFLKNVLPWIPA